MYYVVVNLPFFIVRLIIWHLHDKHISVFLVKNVLGVGLAVQHLHEIVLEVSRVVKSEVHTNDSAAAGGEPASTEMRQLTTASTAENAGPADLTEMAEIHV